MAITVISDLPEQNPVRNEIAVRVSSSSRIVSAGTAFRTLLAFDIGDMPGAGDEIAIFLDPLQTGLPGDPSLQMVVVLTMISGADDSGTQVEEYVGGGLTAWLNNELIPVLVSNYFLSTNYDIHYYNSGGFEGVEMIARTMSTSDDLLLIPGGFSPSFGGYTMGQPETVADHFGFVWQLWAEDVLDSDVFELVVEELNSANDESEAVFRPHKALRALLDPVVPAPGMTTVLEMQDAMTRYYVRVGERTGFPAVTGPLLQLDTQFAHLAGRSEINRVNYPDWSDYLNTGVLRFLTNWPNTEAANAKTVTPAQREFLGFILTNFSLLSTPSLKCDIYYSDGTSTIAHVIEASITVTEGHQYLFATGIEARGLDAIAPTKVIEVYNVYLTHGAGSLVTERRWYKVDHEHHEYFRQLHYLNTAGGWDTLPLTGTLSSDVQVARTLSDRNTGEPANIEGVRDQVVVLGSLDSTRQVGTAYLHIDEVPGLKDFYASECIVERVGTEHWPCTVLDEKPVIEDEDDNLVSFTVKYRRALTQNAVAE